MPASQFPPLQSKPSSKHCTNCSAKMALYTLPGHYDSKVDIDVCMACNAIWFDQFESIQLSPDGTVALFQLIHEHGSTPSASGKFGEGLRCITCGDGMKLTNDQVRNTRFSYQACRKGHGRFSTFYNFLAEKQFVRELTRAERAKLAATVEQVRCSGCGAAVNIGKVDACEYCRAPVSVFDREAAKKAIDHYLLERQKQAPANAGRAVGSGRYAGNTGSYGSSGYDAFDLGSDILYALSRAATRGLGGAGRAAPAAGASGAAMADSNLEAFPDATSALFGSDAAGAVASSLSSGVSSAANEALPSATDALFGGAASDIASGLTGGFTGEIANAFGDNASSGIGDAAAEVVSDLGSSAVDAAGDMASSAGEGVVDLVVDGIGSLLGSLFD
jgi:hypothetical protein